MAEAVGFPISIRGFWVPLLTPEHVCAAVSNCPCLLPHAHVLTVCLCALAAGIQTVRGLLQLAEHRHVAFFPHTLDTSTFNPKTIEKAKLAIIHLAEDKVA